MKLYPPRPWFIYPANVSQLWIIIPICIFLCFCKGGILNGIVVLIVWIIYQANKTEKYWRQACDDNVEHIYVSKDYAISKGYIKIGKRYCYLTDELRQKINKIEKEQQKIEEENRRKEEQKKKEESSSTYIYKTGTIYNGKYQSR